MARNRCPVCMKECAENAPYCTRCGWELSGGLIIGEMGANEGASYEARLRIARKNWRALSNSQKTPERDKYDLAEILPEPFEWCDIPLAPFYKMRDEDGEQIGRYSVRRFQLAKYPITNAQYDQFLKAKDGYKNNRSWMGLAVRGTEPEATFFSGDLHPRTEVNWYEAMAFCRWMSNRLGFEVRLPTDWEWQWAAEGWFSRKYPWGNTFDATKCNCKVSWFGKTTPVDAFPIGASPFGVMDMSGNVWEWCLNVHDEPYSIERGGVQGRVLRGGSWDEEPDLLQVGVRHWADPDLQRFDLGFRIARSR